MTIARQPTAPRAAALSHPHHRVGATHRPAKETAMTNVLNGIMGDVRSLLIGGLILMAIAFVIMTWARTRSLVPTLGAVLFGVIVIAGVTRYSSLRTETQDEIDGYITTDNTFLEDSGD